MCIRDSYVVPEDPVDEHSYRRSSINTESIHEFHDLQSIVGTGATIIDQQSPVEPRSAGQESREVLVPPPEVTRSHPLGDITMLVMTDTVVSAIAEEISARLPQHLSPAVVSKETLSTNTLTPVLVDQGSGPNGVRPQFFLPKNMHLAGLISVVTSHVGEPISAVCEHVAGEALETLEDHRGTFCRLSRRSSPPRS